MYELMLVFHIIVALLLIGLILMQQGKGAQAGAAFGSGASQTVFGSQGSGGFMSRATGTLAAIFFILNLFLAFWINRQYRPAKVVAPIEQTAPATTDAAPKEGSIPE
jgi:preprotein translocase subunit SecG